MLALPLTTPSRVTMRRTGGSSTGGGGGVVGTRASAGGGGGGGTTTGAGVAGGGVGSGSAVAGAGGGVARAVSTGGGGITAGAGGLALASAGPRSAGSVESRWAATNAYEFVGASIFIQSPLVSISLTTVPLSRRPTML